MAARQSTKSRHAGGRNARPVVLVVCEGETELRYFNSLKNHFRASWMEVKLSDVPNPAGILSCAMRELKKLKSKGLDVETWLVFDAESEPESEMRKYRQTIEKALSRGVNVANSSPCFEYWLLIHFAPGINVYEPKQANDELSKPGRIDGYRKPKLPFDTLWEIYVTGKPSESAQKRRSDIELLDGDPRYGRPVTYVDELVDRLVSISRY